MKRRSIPSPLAIVLAFSVFALSGCWEVGFLYDWQAKQTATQAVQVSQSAPELPRAAHAWAADSPEARFNLSHNEWFMPMPPVHVPALGAQALPVTLGFVYQPECREQRFEVRVDEARRHVYLAYVTSDRPTLCNGIVEAPVWTERRFTPQATGAYRVTLLGSNQTYQVEIR